MTDAKALIMRPREVVFAHVERLLQAQGMMIDPTFAAGNAAPGIRPMLGGTSMRSGTLRPPAPGGPTFTGDTPQGPTMAAITERRPPEHLVFEQFLDTKVSITGTLGFREIPGGTSVTCALVTSANANALSRMVAGFVNGRLASSGAASLLGALKRTIDDIPVTETPQPTGDTWG